VEAVFPSRNLGLINANISFAFQAIEKLFIHPTNLCFAKFCKFLGDFWGYSGGDSFSQWISEIERKKKW